MEEAEIDRRGRPRLRAAIADQARCCTISSVVARHHLLLWRDSAFRLVLEE